MGLSVTIWVMQAVSRAGHLRQWVSAAAGWLGIALGVSLLLRGGWGVAPFDAFNSGLALRLGIDVGTASWISASCAVAASWLLGYRPRIGTLLAVAAIGAGINMFLSLINPAPPALGLLLSVAGFAVLVLGAALSVAANVGAGSVETAMLALARPRRLVRRHIGVRNARWALEFALASTAWLLGGELGIFTVLLVLLTGPALARTLPLAERLAGTSQYTGIEDEGDLAAR